MSHRLYRFPSRLKPSFPRAGALALILAALAQAQTVYWNPAAGSADVSRSNNWTSAADGTGSWGKSSLDDDFTADTFTGSPWACLDADNASGSGTCSLTAKADQLALSGKGADVWNTNNQFTAAYRKDLTGNFDVSVKVVSLDYVNEWSKAGILIFNDFTKPSSGGAFAVLATPAHGIKVQFDSSGNVGEFDVSTEDGASLSTQYPVWLRAVKKDGVFSGYYKTKIGNPWILLKTTTTLNTAANSQVGLFAASHDINTSASAVFDDFQVAGDFQPANLDLSFAGTSATADADANLTASLGAKSVNMTGYTGTFSFGSSTLTLSGNAEFSTQANIGAGTGVLAFNGAATQTFSPRPNAVFPNIAKSGAGTLQIVNNPLRAGALTLSAGVFDLGNRSNSFTGLVSTGGSFTAMDAADTLLFTGDANFSGIASMPATGNVMIQSAATASVEKNILFTPGAAAFPNLWFWNQPSSAFAAKIVVAGGTILAKGGLFLRDEKTAPGPLGVVDFKSNNAAAAIDGDLLRLENGAAGNGSLQLLMGNGTWTVKGNVSLSLANSGEAGNSILDLAGPAPANQTLSVSNGAIGNVKHTGTGTLTLGATLNGLSFSQSAGTLNFNNADVNVTGNITVSKGTAGSFSGLGGRTLHAGGSIGLSGQAGNLLNLNPLAGWTVSAGAALTADYAAIRNSAAASPQPGVANFTCTDGKGNTGWNFVPDPTPPSITAQPKDSTALAGLKAGFSVSAAGASPLAYAWRRRGDTTVLSADTVFAINAVGEADNGALFYCTVKNANGSIESRDAKLTVNLPAAVVREPADTAVLAGKAAVFSVSAKGTAALGFQWHKAGMAAPVGTDSILTLAAVTAADNGALYYCTIANAFGSVNTRQAKLTVNEPALITREPKDTAVAAGQNARFTLAAKGTGPLAYAWRKKGDTTVLSADTLYTKTAAALSDSGSVYYCVVTNAFGSDTSAQVKLTVAQGALITRQPVDVSANLGRKAAFSVGAIGAPPLSFRWRRKGDTATVSKDSVYNIAAVKLTDNGALFTVTVTNAFGSAVSREAKLTVVVCDSVFSVTPETLTVDEGQPVKVTGKAACSQRYYWAVLSGPAPKLLDPETEVLAFTAPRVTVDTLIAYRFSAEYEAHIETKDVKIRVRNAIPDPLITLPAKSQWGGSKPLVLRPVVTNAAAIKASKYAPPFRYQWFLSAEVADTVQAGDSLTLSDPVQDGVLEVTLCLDNGGAVSCAVSSVTISRIASGLSGKAAYGGPVSLAGRSLIWNLPARVRVWDWRGRLLWDRRGGPGEASELPDEVFRSLLGRRARLEILP